MMIVQTTASPIVPVADPARDAWLDAGRTLAAERRDVDWRLGDWMLEGREKGYLDQAGFDFLSDNLGIAPKRLKVITRAAETFPRHLRDETLTIEHHAYVADLPRDEQMHLLGQARREHWNDDDLRKHVINHKVRTGRVDSLSGEEWDHHALVALQHAWNRANPHVRAEFLEMAQEANGGVIDV
ncbi:hypothetical protein [Rhizorhabdus histidinilytica]|uniref:hypothetical protein n=1 Tax=Rhizorhabdus histidinilytica TaxID=439228 RepID=UPI003220276E